MSCDEQISRFVQEIRYLRDVKKLGPASIRMITGLDPCFIQSVYYDHAYVYVALEPAMIHVFKQKYGSRPKYV